MNRVVVHRRVAKYLQKLPRGQKEKVKGLLRSLEQAPDGLSDVTLMSGEWAGYRRVRLGALRVVFWYDKESSLVYVDYVGPRGDVYK